MTIYHDNTQFQRLARMLYPQGTIGVYKPFNNGPGTPKITAI